MLSAKLVDFRGDTAGQFFVVLGIDLRHIGPRVPEQPDGTGEVRFARSLSLRQVAGGKSDIARW
jgi:hypothetical protein